MAKLDLIGSSTRFRTVFNQISMVAPVDSALLVQGETGELNIDVVINVV